MVSIASSTPLPLFAPRDTSAPPRFDDGEHADFSFELAAADQRVVTPEPPPPTRKFDAGRKTGSDVAAGASGSASSGARARRTDSRKEDRADDAKDQPKDTAPVATQTDKPAAEPTEKSSGQAVGSADPENTQQTPPVQASEAAAASLAGSQAVSPVAKEGLPGWNVGVRLAGKSDAVPTKTPATPTLAGDPKASDEKQADLAVETEAVQVQAAVPEAAPKPDAQQAVRVEKPAAEPSPVAPLKGRFSRQSETDQKYRAVQAQPTAIPTAAPQLGSQPAPGVEDGGKQAQTDAQSLSGTTVTASVTGSPRVETEAQTKSDAALAFAVRLSDRQTDSAAPATKQPAGFKSELPPAPQLRSAGNVATISKSEPPTGAAADKPLPGVQAAMDPSGAAKPPAPLRPQVTEHSVERKTATEDTPAAVAQPAVNSAPAVAASGQPSATESAPVHRADAPEAPAPPAAQEAPATSTAQRPSEPLRDISVRIGSDGDSRVDVRLTDRAGELRIEVRTPDAHLNKSLRDGLPELAERLETAGRTNQVWRPADSGASLSDHGSRESQNQSGSSQSQNNSRQNPQSGNDGGRRGRQNPQEEPAGGQEESFAAYLRQGRGNR